MPEGAQWFHKIGLYCRICGKAFESNVFGLQELESRANRHIAQEHPLLEDRIVKGRRDTVT